MLRSKRQRYTQRRKQPQKHRRRSNLLRFEPLEPRRLLATVSWAVDSDGFWDEGSNWSTGAIPEPGDDVVIDRPGGDFTITHRNRVATNVASITSDERIVVDAGLLNVSGSVTLNGDLDLLGHNSELRINDDLTVNSTITIDGTGRIFADSDATINGPGTIVFAGNASTSGVLSAQDGNTLTLGAGLTVRGGRARIGGNGELINQGTIIADLPGANVMAGFNLADSSFSNQGTMSSINGSALFFPGPWTNEGAITTTDSALTLGSTFYEWDNNGTITANNSIVNLDGAFSQAEIGTLDRTGGTVNLAGTLDNTDQTLELNATTGDWVLKGGRINGGTIQFVDGQTLHIANGANVLSGVTLNSDLELAESNSGFLVVNGMTVNSTITLGESGARITSNSTQAIGGTGTIVFDGNPQFTQTYLSLDDNSTLTLEEGITLRGRHARIGGSGEVINLGTITADIPGETIALGLNVDDSKIVNRGTVSAVNGAEIRISGDWTNEASIEAIDSTLSLGSTNFQWDNNGTIAAENSIVNLGGAFSQNELGVFSRTGGEVNLVGTLNNSGQTFELNAQTGGWTIDGGRINGGTLDMRDGIRLQIARNSANHLSGVTVNGDVDLAVTQAELRISNGLTLNGNMILSEHFARLVSTTIQTIDGLGVITLAGITNSQRRLEVIGDTTLTLGPGITVRGGGSFIGVALAFDGGSGVGNIINEGTIVADLPGPDLSIYSTNPNGEFTNRGTLSAIDGTLQLNNFSGALGRVSAVNGTVVLDGNTMVGAGDSLTAFPGGTISVPGNLTGGTTVAVRFDIAGTVLFSGSGVEADPQMFEVMGADLGNDHAGFDNNFGIGAIHIERDTYVRLVDESDNSAGDGPEAIYAGSLIVASDSTLDLNGRNLYVRAAQIDGTVVGGSITELPESGVLDFGVPTQGSISAADEVDDWEFFGRQNQTISVVVNSGGESSSVLEPHLGLVQVELVDENENVLATGSNLNSGDAVILEGVLLPADGIYSVRVQASAENSDATGNYLIAAYDVVHDRRDLVVNNTSLGAIETPLSDDRWTFTAAAGTQVRFDLINQSGSIVLFDLVGPNGYVGFADQVTDSDLIVLPDSGQYEIIARSADLQYGGVYTFRLDQTPQVDLTLGVAFEDVFVDRGQANLYSFQTTDSSPLFVQLDDSSSLNQNEVYVKFGSPPTRGDHDFHASTTTDADQKITIPNGPPGTWFVLVYSNSTPEPGTFTILGDVFDVHLDTVTPDQHGDAADAVLVLAGVGFDSTAQVELVAADSTVYPASSVTVDSFFRVTATFAAGSVPPGSYTMRVQQDSGVANELSDAIEITEGGAAVLETKLILPSFVGRRGLSSFYVEYANTGTVAMPAPLLRLVATDRALLTHDQSLLRSGFWTSATPRGFSDSVRIWGNGETFGVLNPGETVRVPVYYIGLQQPFDLEDFKVNLKLDVLSADTDEPIDWEAMKDGLRPDNLNPRGWDIAYQNLQQQIGETWGDFYAAMNENARYLARLGQPTTELDDLVQFEFFQATGLNPVGDHLNSAVDIVVDAPGMPIEFGRSIASTLDTRHDVGPLGYGWNLSGNWHSRLIEETDGSVIISNNGFDFVFQPDSRNRDRYFSPAGSDFDLRGLPNDEFELVWRDGQRTVIGADRRVQYVEDNNGNRITATWASGKLTRLEHTAGQFIDISYDGARISSLTDSAGRTVSYTYDGANQHLLSVHGSAAHTTRYDYHDATVAANEHALESIEYPDLTHEFFTFDAQGRLESQSLDDDAERVFYTYDSTGTVTVTNELGDAIEYYFDHDGRVTGFQNALGKRTLVDFDNNGNLTWLLDPLGNTLEFDYDSRGNLTRTLDPLRRTNAFEYQAGTNLLLKATDGRQNDLRYSYDAAGNLETITYPDNSVETFGVGLDGRLDTLFNRRDEVIDVEFDDDGRFERYDLPDNSFLAYDYDARGNVTQIEAADGLTSLEYTDSLNPDLPTKITDPSGRFIDYTYQSGRRTSMVTNTGFTINYAYDSAGRVERLTDDADGLIVQYQYDPTGQIERADNGNGTFTQYGYDPVGRLESIVHRAADGTINSRFDYVHDALGRRTEMSMLDGTWTYEYDAAGQLELAELVSNTLENQTLEYTYDETGNVTKSTINGAVVDFTINDLDQIVGVGDDTLNYDLDGNLVERVGPNGTDVYTYNAVNQLLQANRAGVDTSYVLGAFDQLTAIVSDGVRTEYLLDPTGLGNVVAQFDDADELVANFAHGSQLVSQIPVGGDAAYYDADGVGSIVGVSGGSGDYLNSYSYLPYGTALSATETIANPFQFNGAFGVMGQDDELVYMRNRFYEPELGIFTSTDPLRLQEPNLYRFADNDPIRFVDPLGLAPCGSDPSFVDSLSNFGEAATFARGVPFPVPSIPGGCQKEFGDGIKAFQRLSQGKSPYLNAGRFSQFLPGGDPSSSGSVDIARASDPNQKTGANGFGPANYIVPDTVIPYRVDFENLESATAPAQRVFITDQLDSNLDWSTLQFTEAGFGDYFVSVPEPSQHFETTLDVIVEEKAFAVDIELDLDVQTGMVTAVFQSLQPGTELPPADVLTGLLPPEDGTGRGQGFFGYTIDPIADLASGTEIRNIALITFDVNESIATNQIDPLDASLGTDPAKEALNTIDVGDPTSAVADLPEAVATANFNVTWTGQDDPGGSGISDYDLYVSVDDGPLEIVVFATTDTSYEFTGVSGSTYGFLTVAHDNVGHVEALADEVDTQTLVIIGAWVNRSNIYDVNANGEVTSLDALQIINQLSQATVFDSATGILTPLPPDGFSPPYYDVTDDGRITALDALRVINQLDELSGQVGPSGEFLQPANSFVHQSTDRNEDPANTLLLDQQITLWPANLNAQPTIQPRFDELAPSSADTDATKLEIETLIGEFADDIAENWIQHELDH